MQLLLPVDSRVEDTHGFMVLDTANGSLEQFVVPDASRYRRRGFRGACVVGSDLFVCNSHSIKRFRRHSGTGTSIDLRLVETIARPEWLHGGAAHADLHTVTPGDDGQLLVTNTYMDCLDVIGEDGGLVARTFLWEMNDDIAQLVVERDLTAADLCHLNHIDRTSGATLLTLGNLNGTGRGAVLDASSGQLVLNDIPRPHDGTFSNGDYLVTATSKFSLWVYRAAAGEQTLGSQAPVVVDLRAGLEDGARFWARGILATDDEILVSCSQMQNRAADDPSAVASHVAVVDRRTLRVVNRWWIPTDGLLTRPVLFSIIDLATLPIT